MTSPLFSVITVCRNAERVLAMTAQSLAAQSVTDYEWIVIDGQSVDDTCRIAREHLVATRDTLVSEADDGVYHAMNKGLRLASGRFVLFLNAGDAFADTGTLSVVRDAIDSTVDVLHGDVIFRLPNGNTVYRRSREAVRGIDRRVLASHQSIYVRREVHLRTMFDTGLEISADFAAIASLHARGARFRYLPTALSVTSLDPDSISIRGRPQMAWEDIRVNREIRGLSSPRAYALYLRARLTCAVVSGIRALPAWASRLLPERLRRRIY